MLVRGTPVVVLAAAAFAAGATLAGDPGQAARRLATRYTEAWSDGDVSQMYALLDPGSQARVSERRFAALLGADAATATATAVHPLRVGSRTGATVPVRMVLDTHLWGVLHETLRVTLSGGAKPRVHLTDAVLFPGLRAGERLRRQTRLPTRGEILAADGTPLAQGPDRTSPIPDVAGQIVGTLGPIPSTERARYRARGYPVSARVGVDGLERIFQDRLAGTPGGELEAGRRVLASARPVAASSVTSTIDPALERAAVSALGGQYAGMAVMDPSTGALEALAGIAFSALQPPGSTMKIVTATAALQAKLVKLSTTFPIATQATIDGFSMQNAGGEACGGTLINAFAVSCNSVFAPLGVTIGAKRLVATATRFGFDQPPSIPGAAQPTIPSAATIGNDLSVGSSAIGQGLVQTTPLGMADVAATIAMGGQRPIPTLLAHQAPRFVRVTSPTVAREVQQMMVAVVQYGTGTPAAIPGVQVAGKTGTAELTNTGNGSTTPNASSPKNTDAWFVGYAPVGHPKVVVGALFPNQGAGAAAAAPPVKQMIEAALAR